MFASTVFWAECSRRTSPSCKATRFDPAIAVLGWSQSPAAGEQEKVI